MSTADSFAFPFGLFPQCLSVTASPTVPTGFDFVDITVEKAMELLWNLEEFTVEIAGSQGDIYRAPGDPDEGPLADLGVTVTLSPTLSSSKAVILGSDASSGWMLTATRTHIPPSGRVCASSPLRMYWRMNFVGDISFLMDFRLVGIVSSTGLVRLAYQFDVKNSQATGGIWIGGAPRYFIAIYNPTRFVAPWLQPPGISSGTVYLLGIPLQWIGGGHDDVNGLWAEPPDYTARAPGTIDTFAITSSTYTY